MSLDDFQSNLQHIFEHQGQYWALRKMTYFILLPFPNSNKATESPTLPQYNITDKEVIT